MNYIDEIKKLKKENDIILLAHYYVDANIQESADFVGDSYQLAKVASNTNQKIICFAGVHFMGESAKILNPNKKVIVPELRADCPMAHMITPKKILEMREKYDDLAVVSYVNTTAEIKAYSDVCVTSSNAVKIVKNLPQKNIFFVPDKNLGEYIKNKIISKNIILNDGYCHVHNEIRLESVKSLKKIHPNAKILAHPECVKSVSDYADFVGSTKALLNFVKTSKYDEFIICTEIGILHKMKKYNPKAKYYIPDRTPICPNMKKNTIEKVYLAMRNLTPEIKLDDITIEKASNSLKKMIEITENLSEVLI